MILNKYDVDKISTIISPSNLREANVCTKQHILSKGKKGYDKYHPLHAKFGHAFGASCAKLVELADKPRQLRLGWAKILVFVHIKYNDAISYKNIVTLYDALESFDTLWQNKYKCFKYHSTEVRILVDIYEDGKLYLQIGGAYDLAATKSDGTITIFDFKAISSDYLYNWSTEPQLMHYCLLYKILNRSVKINIGSYFIALFLEKVASTSEKFNVPDIYKMLGSHLTNCKKLFDDINKFKDDRNTDAVPYNPKACFGKTYCSFTSECYGETESLYEHKIDDREFTDIHYIKLDKDEFDSIVEALSYDLAEQARSVKSLSKHPDLSSISVDNLPDLSTLFTE